MRRTVQVLALVAALAVVAAACSATGDTAASEREDDGAGPSTTAAAARPTAGAERGTYGSLRDVCGPGDARLPADQAGTSAPGTVKIGVASDRTSTIRPGLNKEMWDASQAFAGWCNDQGGIRGLEVVPVELDGALFQVEAAMTTACRDVFAMVGGGFVQDDLEFSGKDGSDFHRCGMVDIPGFAVSPAKTDSNGQVEPLPNSATSQANTWFRDFKRLEPRAAAKVAIAYGELPPLELTKDKNAAALADVGMDLVATLPYPPTGTSDWTPLARRVIDSGATTLIWVGEPNFLASLLAKLREQGWTGTPLLETNMYDPLLFSAGTDGPEGAVVRMSVAPTEEADRWPAVRQYLDTLEEYVPDSKTGALGMQSTSAWLLFATAAGACADRNGGVIDRTCVLRQAAARSGWTGGGLHAPTDPGPADRATATACGMLVQVHDGRFRRLYPRVGGPGDDGGGFHCPADGVTQVPSLAGRGKVDPNRPI